MSELVASVVIGFKDWGLDRLQRCITSVQGSFAEVTVEVIVSDYGSLEGEPVAAAAAEAGARYVRTETDGTWSRSRALNAGFAVARGQQFFATDADMIFTPGALASVSRRLDTNPREAIILQCRDLPPDVAEVPVADTDWQRYERAATIRPRWGMGGLVATHREVFHALRGYDERMHTYGGEDIDFGKRLRRFGVPINWLDQPHIRMYHVWHPSSRLAATLDEAAEAAIGRNRRIHVNDLTTARNRTLSQIAEPRAVPLVSVVAQADRPAGVLRAELSNVLGQSVRDLEVLLVDTGGDGTIVAQQLNDDRVRVVPPPAGGWWHALAQASGTYSILHAPGSWHAPTRLETLLDHTAQRHHMPADAFVTAVATDNGELLPLPAREDAARTSPWSSLLLPTATVQSLLRTFPQGGTDPGDLVVGLLRNGLSVTPVLAPAGAQVLEEGVVSELMLDDMARSAQKLAWRLRAGNLPDEWLFAKPAPAAAREVVRSAQQLMNDQVDLVVWSSDDDVLESLERMADQDTAIHRCEVSDPSGERLMTLLKVAGLSGSLGRALRSQAASSILAGTTRIDTLQDDGEVTGDSSVRWMIEEYSRLYGGDPETAVWVVVRAAEAGAVGRAVQEMERLADVTVVLHRVVHDGTGAPQHVALGLVSAISSSLRSLLSVRASVSQSASVHLWLGQDCDTSLQELAVTSA
ncbi:glycosyltransferase [Ornithinimicrobium cavernae]|uniref:glycosyltransferase n=1 Tax=Ornithinimicrobium cavernae TaxID=2666047 RepID=UPI000D69090D|nr:glycosyltransferase [Ornithinimicrobium cavernae]